MQPVFKILANNDNVTELIKERLIRLSITDEIGFVSDVATIVIDNHDDQVEVPARGAELEVYLGYDVDALVKMGKFMVDEVELSGPPNQISITARSSDTFEKSNLGSIVSPKSRSWHNITFPDMVAAIAKENKLSPLVSPRLEGIIVDHIDQTEESDLAFLNRVAQTVDSYVKPADGKLIVAPIGTAISPKKEEKPMPTTELDVTDINSWRIRIAERNKINSVEVKYHDKKKGILDTVRTGKGKPCFCVPHTYASATTAMRIAKSKLAALKASDLLQSNCVIWVEGPSDRIYIKKWLELFGGNDLEEGLDYQFLYYGGTLLSHYTANVEEKKNTDSLIEMLKINRHSYVVMDSDKKSSEDQLKDRVKRIQKEFSNAHWVTAGKEIENYLPTEALHNYFDSSLNVEQFSFFPDIYKNIKKVETFDKVKFALDITKNKNYTKENLAKCLDLHKQTEMLIDFIRKSNQEIC